jgi:hypothetical protein
VRPVASIDAGTSTARPPVDAPGVFDDDPGAAVVAAVPADEWVELHPARNMPIATVAEIPVQRHDRRAESTVMQPDRTPANPQGAVSDFGARLAELQAMLDILERARARANADLDTRPRRFDGDPVALTQALHPDGLRRTRRTANQPAGDHRSLAVRLVLFDGSPGTRS